MTGLAQLIVMDSFKVEDMGRCTALQLASFHGQLEVVRRLLQHGAQLETRLVARVTT